MGVAVQSVPSGGIYGRLPITEQVCKEYFGLAQRLQLYRVLQMLVTSLGKRH